MALVTFIVAFVTLVVVLYQVHLMNRQQETMDKQLVIMQKQDELLARRADLVVEVSSNDVHLNRSQWKLYFSIKNNGTKSAEKIQWHVLVPLEYDPREFVAHAINKDAVGLDRQTIHGIEHNRYKALTVGPVYPTRRIDIGNITVRAAQAGQSVVILWEAIAEDGRFPSGPDLGKIEISRDHPPLRRVDEND